MQIAYSADLVGGIEDLGPEDSNLGRIYDENATTSLAPT